MKKRIAPLSGKEWLKYKPYERVSRYDQYYIKLAREISSFFWGIHEYGYDWGREQDYDLAVILASYFEDIANEIGIWEEVVKLGLEKTEQEFPLFDDIGYKLGQLNWQDIALIVWGYISIHSSKLISPDIPYLEPMANAICELFEHELEFAPQTDFYEEYLVIDDESDFEELKTKLTWLSLDSWVFGPDLFPKLKEEAIKTRETEDFNEWTFSFDALNLLTNYTLHTPSAWWGLLPREVFARVIDASDSYLEELTDLKAFELLEWAFVLEADQGEYYSFVEPNGSFSLELIKSNQALDGEQARPGQVGIIQCIKWLGKWYSTANITFTDDHSIIRELESGVRPMVLYTPEEKGLIQETIEAMQRTFIDIFGHSYATFNDKLEAQNMLGEFLAQLPNAEGEENRAPAAPSVRSSQTDEEGQVGVAFIPGEGLSFWPALPSILEELSRIKDGAVEEPSSLFFKLYTGGIPPLVFEELAQDEAVSQVPFPIPASAFDPFPHHRFLMRFFRPEAFAVKIPNIDAV